ncbi:MAG: DUF4399 domain-containing protein [Acaryochloridaceae cyanobacterium RL_2_7]|nr:DUF4399 domain-containing protein [Acaryochloridaceae cyanobacterium RL_2_7]
MKTFKTVMAVACALVTMLFITGSPSLANVDLPEAPANAEAYFIAPNNNAKVNSSFDVKFGLKGMGVAPAGVEMENTGHHHLLIDMDSLPDLDRPLPKTDQIKHFGGGQTETQLELTPGKHTLQLLLGNYQHIPHSKPVLSDKVTVIVSQ